MRPEPGIAIEACDQVYPPSEDTYLLLECLEVRPGERVLEMGCGSGFIALHCARAGAVVTAADISPRAVECARRNARGNDIAMDVVLSDLFLDVQGRFDVILFNPPYLPDPEQEGLARSWAGGEDGARVLDRFLQQAPGHLQRGGRVYVVLSSLMSGGALQCALSQFVRDRMGSLKLFFEELWVERLVLR